jgi:hypothetical protein
LKYKGLFCFLTGVLPSKKDRKKATTTIYKALPKGSKALNNSPATAGLFSLDLSIYNVVILQKDDVIFIMQTYASIFAGYCCSFTSKSLFFLYTMQAYAKTTTHCYLKPF